LKFGVYVHPTRPKVPIAEIVKKIEGAGMSFSLKDPEIAVVVGGDGTFGYYGRILSAPMLFVGVNEYDILGSRARLAEITYDNLENSLCDIENDNYCIMKRNMLSINLDHKSYEVLTDVYLERGVFSGCLRYKVNVKDNQSKTEHCDYAIGNGIIISTSFGSGGYFSYPERLARRKWDETNEKFLDTKLGICHIVPTYIIREKNGKKSISHRVSYAVPNSSCIEIKLVRMANVRLYGVTAHSSGIPIGLNDKITIRQSANTAKIIKLKHQRT
jgi:NAD+ kinase